MVDSGSWHKIVGYTRHGRRTISSYQWRSDLPRICHGFAGLYLSFYGLAFVQLKFCRVSISIWPFWLLHYEYIWQSRDVHMLWPHKTQSIHVVLADINCHNCCNSIHQSRFCSDNRCTTAKCSTTALLFTHSSHSPVHTARNNLSLTQLSTPKSIYERMAFHGP